MRTRASILGLLALVGLLGPRVVVGEPAHGQRKKVTVMSRNLYVGGDLGPVTAAVLSGTVPAILAQAGALWASVQATDFPARAQALALEVRNAKPDLIGLQEASLWRTGPAFSSAEAVTVAYDYVEILREALRRRGLHYDVAAESRGFDVELPAATSSGFLDVRLTDREVVLVRRDAGFTVSNPHEGHFVNVVSLSSPFGEIVVKRGFAAVDVAVADVAFRFVTTHLEPDAPALRLLEASELVSGPCDTALPVVLVGDLNSDANGSPSGSAYRFLTLAGLQDAWAIANPGDPGITCCHDAPLSNPVPFSQPGTGTRTDVVLFQGGVTVVEADRLGESPEDRADGRWPSDHAGVAAVLRIPR